MPNKGQGLPQKGDMANKTKLEEADTGGPAGVPGDDRATKEIPFEGLRGDGCRRALNLPTNRELVRRLRPLSFRWAGSPTWWFSNWRAHQNHLAG